MKAKFNDVIVIDTITAFFYLIKTIYIFFAGGSDLPHSFMVLNTGINALPCPVREYSTLGGTSG